MTTRGSHRLVRATRGGRSRFVALGLAATMLIAACSSDGDSSSTSGPTTSTSSTGNTTGTTNGTGSTSTTTPDNDPDNTGAQLIRGVKLSEGHATAVGVQPVPVVDGSPLDDAAIAAVAERLPAWVVEEALAKAFNWPTESLPKPVAGTSAASSCATVATGTIG